MCLKPYLTMVVNGKMIPLKKLAQNKMQFTKQFETIESENIVEIPCGKCKECQIKKIYEWKNRLEQECKYTKENKMFFATLTYDNEHIKNLNKRDIQLFLKRYRKHEKIRYFYVGELGKTTKRQHYHIIIFGNIPKDIEEDNAETKSNFKQYKSKFLDKIWQNGRTRLCKMKKGLIKYILKDMFKNAGTNDFIYGASRKPPLGIRTETIQERITQRNRTKAEKQFYKNHYGDLPKIESLEKDKIHKIKEIEKQTKMSYYYYIEQKRQAN